jgi:hypothetical protein
MLLPIRGGGHRSRSYRGSAEDVAASADTGTFGQF